MNSPPHVKHLIDLDRERSIAQLLGLAVDLYRRYPWGFIVLALMIIAPYDITVLAVTGRGPLGNSSSPNLFTPMNAAQLLVIAPTIAALYARAVRLIHEGGEPELPHVVVDGLRALPIVLIAQVFSYLGIGIATAFLIIPGILLGLRWCVTTVAVAVEGRGPFAAMGRSGELAAGHYWHIFFITLLTEGVAVATAFGAHSIPTGSSSSVATVVFEIALQTAIACYTALILTVLYFDLCARFASDPQVH